MERSLEKNPYFGTNELNLFTFYDQYINKNDVWKYWETRSYITSMTDEEKIR